MRLASIIFHRQPPATPVDWDQLKSPSPDINTLPVMKLEPSEPRKA